MSDSLMGECLSRPSQQEIENQMNVQSSENDANFRYPPYQSITIVQLNNEKNIESLEHQRSLIFHKKIELQSKISALNPADQIPELNIEVQKGINLQESGICLFAGKPYVVVNLEPNGPRFETFESNIFKPSWYRLYQIKRFINYEKIIFTVVCKKNYIMNENIGVIEIPFTEINNQLTKEGWFPVEGENSELCKIRIRVQYLFDEEKLIQGFIEDLDMKIAVIDERIEIIKQEDIRRNEDSIGIIDQIDKSEANL